jgi:hypothetical protein
MTIQEAKLVKDQLEVNLLELIRKFEEDTHLTVRAVELKQQSKFGQPDITVQLAVLSTI